MDDREEFREEFEETADYRSGANPREGRNRTRANSRAS